MSYSEAGTLLNNRAYLITETTAAGALYGLTFALYIFCARSLYLQLENKDRRRQHLFTLLYMSLLMALGLCGTALDSQEIQTSYVDHADYNPFGGFGYALYVYAQLPIAPVGNGTACLFYVMLYGIQIWRLWVIWSASRYSLLVVVLPVLSLLGNLGMGITFIIATRQTSEISPLLSGTILYGELAFQMYISVAVTLLITGRIAFVRRRHIKLMGQTNIASPYTSIISILVESFALESVWLIVQAIVSSVGQNAIATAAATAFQSASTFIQLLAYLLVVYRVTMGREWKEDTEEKLTSLQWNQDGLQSTQTETRESIPVADEEV